MDGGEDNYMYGEENVDSDVNDVKLLCKGLHMGKGARSTILDVAKAASVSVATVSRYINGTAFVNPDTAKRINRVITELDYHPNKMARALKMERTNMIMMVVPDISNQYYSEQYKIIQEIGEQKGYTIFLYNTNESLESELNALKIAQENHYDGLIYQTMYRTDEMLRKLETLSIPYVTPSFKNNPDTYAKGIYNTTRYLISIGHRKIIYVGGSPKTWINTQRRNGFIRAMEEAGIEYDETDWFEMDFSFSAGYKAGKYISALNSRPTAICAANDQLAIGMMLAFQESGIRIPEDISITGMDDIEYARMIAPALTTVKNDPVPTAEYMINKLLRLIDDVDDDIPFDKSESGDVIIRNSTREIRE